MCTLIIFNKAATNGPPITKVKSKDLTLSVKKSIGVCLLNPCFFSIRKVEYYKDNVVEIMSVSTSKYGINNQKIKKNLPIQMEGK